MEDYKLKLLILIAVCLYALLAIFFIWLTNDDKDKVKDESNTVNDLLTLTRNSPLYFGLCGMKKEVWKIRIETVSDGIFTKINYYDHERGCLIDGFSISAVALLGWKLISLTIIEIGES